MALQKITEGMTGQQAADIVYNNDRSLIPWLDSRSTPSISGNLVVNAIKKIDLIGCDPSKTYRITTLCKNHATYKNRIIIQEDGVNLVLSNLESISTEGIQIIRLAKSGKTILITIDYSELTDGFIFNTYEVPLIISKTCHFNPEITNAIANNTNAIGNLLGENTQSPNYSYGYPYIYMYFEYLPGHSAATDLITTTDAPTLSGITSLCSAVAAFNTKTGDSSYFLGKFKTDILALLRSYNNEDGVPISPLIMSCKIHNSHPTESAQIQCGFRTKKDGNWYTPMTSQFTLLPGETKSVSIKCELTGEQDWIDTITFNLIDFYGYARSSAPEENPAWIYFGDMDVYFNDPKKRETRPIIPGKSIIGGIEEEQLSNDLRNRLQDNNALIPIKKSIVLSGSSITWGSGLLDSSFVAIVDDYVKEFMSNTMLAENMAYSETPTTFTNKKLYKSTGKKLTGLNKKVSFSIKGDELVICQTKLRSPDYGIMRVKADGILIGTFDNKNDTIGEHSETFTGNGTTVKFQLAHPCTYAHNVTVNGATLIAAINTGGYGGTFPSGVDVLVIRKLNSIGEPIHVAWFADPPANNATIVIGYKYGRIIAHERSLLGQTDVDTINESTYGDGNTSFDPDNPSSMSSGMEFRAVDINAMFIHKFTSVAKRKIEIEIIGGNNPYFIINYASNRYHDLMNAGIGGWTVARLTDGDKVNDLSDFYKYSMPDIIVQESATNDDWSYSSRKLTRVVTGITEADVKKLCTLELKKIEFISADNFTVTFTTGLIAAISKFGLTCPQIIGSTVAIGDIVRIGNYYGDTKQVVCREISAVDSIIGSISWLTPLNTEDMINVDGLTDLIGKEISIRSLTGYQSAYEDFIEKIQKISPHTKILVAQPGLSNYFRRQLWGYEITHRRLAAKYSNVETIEITDWLRDFQNHCITGANYTEITANGSDFYDLPWTGHWQGFKVLVDGINVYGKDCYIHSGDLYTVNPGNGGADLNLNGGYVRPVVTTKNMRLIFTKNKPLNGIIRIERANAVWSTDFTHPNDMGNYIYAQAYITAINQLV